MEHWHRSGTALLDEIAATHLPASQLAVWYIGQCGFIFKCGETTFCIDPVLSDLTGPNGSRRCYPAPFAPGQLQADFVLCTHGHADHMAKDTLRGLAQNDETQFIFPSGCRALAHEYGVPEERIQLVQEGSALELGPAHLRAFSAAHPEHVLDAADPRMALGYQLDLGGFTVVHFGDTYLTPRLYAALEALPQPDLLLAPSMGRISSAPSGTASATWRPKRRRSWPSGSAPGAASPPTTTWCRATPPTLCGSFRPCADWTPPPGSPCPRWASG